MLLSIPIKIVPKLWRQNVLTIHFLIEQITKARSLLGYEFTDIAKSEALMDIQIPAKTYQHYSLSMLWQKVSCIDHFWICPLGCIDVSNLVAQLIESFANDSESIALIVAFEVFYIFKQKRSRSLCCDNPSHIKKQSALGFTFKTMFTPQGIFFGNSGKGERLTWKTC
ncbi:hypothetical protein AXG94_08565 [Pseudomonas corrugata]|nr:hypothetical protein AXG94_08565 [Pseudomonas corrugata]